MRFVKNLAMAGFMLGSLVHIAGIGSRIRRARASGDREAERRQIRVAEDVWTSKFFARYKIDVHIEGREHLINGPFLVVANHQSYGDIPVIMEAVRDVPVGFVARADLAKLPFYGKWIARVRSLFIQRQDARSALQTVKDGEAILREGFSLVIFPEGTRHKDGKMGEFMKGTLRMARQAGVPILPITIYGTNEIYEINGYLQAASVWAYIHESIPTADWGRHDEEQTRQKIEDDIRTKLLEFAEKGRYGKLQ